MPIWINIFQKVEIGPPKISFDKSQSGSLKKKFCQVKNPCKTMLKCLQTLLKVQNTKTMKNLKQNS